MKRKSGKLSLQIPNYPEYLARQIRLYKGAEELWAKDVVDFLSQNNSPGKKIVVDAGSGAGIMTLAIARISKRKGLNVEITGIDMLPEMVSYARQRAEEEGLSNVYFLQEDVTNLSLPDNSVDMVTATFLFFFLNEEELPKLLREVYRILKPEGRFYFFHPQRNYFVYALTLILTRGRKKYELDTIRHSYTVGETKILIEQSPLASENRFKSKSRWGPLMVEAYGTISKTSPR